MREPQKRYQLPKSRNDRVSYSFKTRLLISLGMTWENRKKATSFQNPEMIASFILLKRGFWFHWKWRERTAKKLPAFKIPKWSRFLLFKTRFLISLGMTWENRKNATSFQNPNERMAQKLPAFKFSEWSRFLFFKTRLLIPLEMTWENRKKSTSFQNPGMTAFLICLNAVLDFTGKDVR